MVRDFWGISGAWLEHLQDCANAILAFKPVILIPDLRGNDLADPVVDVHNLLAQFLVTIKKILDLLLACLMTRVVILKQQNPYKVTGSGMHYSTYNHGPYEWHEDLLTIEG